VALRKRLAREKFVSERKVLLVDVVAAVDSRRSRAAEAVYVAIVVAAVNAGR